MWEIELYHLPCPLLERFLRVMQVPFPALRFLKLDLGDKSVPAPVLPDTFLGGSAPRLQRLTLSGIPTLPKLLTSCHDIVEVRLSRIPNTGYVSPSSMVTALSELAKLEVLDIGFESPASRPDRHPPPSTRVVLPALTQLEFHGASEYFEDLVARIDTPTSSSVKTEFFNQLVFDNPQFLQFVGRTKVLGSFEQASLWLGKSTAKINLFNDRLDSPVKPGTNLHIHILCDAVDWQVSGLARICVQFLTLLSNVEHCSVVGTQKRTHSLEDDVDWITLNGWSFFTHSLLRRAYQ